jgi:hypothetical protein
VSERLAIVRGGHSARVCPIILYRGEMMRILGSASIVMLLTAALVLAAAFPLVCSGGLTEAEQKAVSMLSESQKGRQESEADAGTTTVGPPKPAHTTGESVRPEPTPEELKRLEERVREGTHLPGPPLPEVGTPEPPPPGSQTTPKEAPLRRD